MEGAADLHRASFMVYNGVGTFSFLHIIKVGFAGYILLMDCSHRIIPFSELCIWNMVVTVHTPQPPLGRG